MLRRFLCDAVRASDNRAFHRDQVGYHFRRGPLFGTRFSGPLVGWYGIRRSEERCLRFRQFLNDGYEGPHSLLERGAVGLLKRVRQLQHASFAKGGPDHLQAHRQLATDPSTGHGDAGKACQ